MGALMELRNKPNKKFTRGELIKAFEEINALAKQTESYRAQLDEGAKQIDQKKVELKEALQFEMSKINQLFAANLTDIKRMSFELAIATLADTDFGFEQVKALQKKYFDELVTDEITNHKPKQVDYEEE